ncbi:MAG: methylated-DNA--[protein]-cysteine S-methyltransferase [Nitrospirota bacterium]
MRTIILPRASRREVERALREEALSSNGPPSPLAPCPSPETEPVLRAARAQITAYLAGQRRDIDVPVDLSGGSAFQRRVWRAIRRIPYGRVRSYKWVASRVGGARYARAVGLALGANPVPLVIPCHRVVTSGGSLGGFTGGQHLKRRLLALEGSLAQLR